MVFNLTSLNGLSRSYHEFSLYFILPYIGTTTALLVHNWYPSKVFAGDTFCYFSGMTFAVVSILGHFSKTLLLFFIPQIANFLYSLPQLFHVLPCPRHRLPKYLKDEDVVTMSTTTANWKDIKPLGKIIINILSKLGFLHVIRDQSKGVETVQYNNLTIINLVLKFYGPMHEQSLTLILLGIQFICSILAFMVRYPLAHLLFGEIVV
jgi:UDP-N-acetylglucosamine--dolichyl-phosphate N-acetylglucosaminephosphotransferase